jgi:hypothetical protein
VFNPKVPSIHPRLEGKALFGNVPLLDEMARLLNVRTLTSFMDTRPLPEAVDIGDAPIGDPDRLDQWIRMVQEAEAERELREPWSEWFSAADGAETMRALARRLEKAESSFVARRRETVGPADRVLGEGARPGLHRWLVHYTFDAAGYTSPGFVLRSALRWCAGSTSIATFPRTLIERRPTRIVSST